MISSILLWMPGAWEILLIALIVLLLFGGKKIPELMRGLGKGVKEFKDSQKDSEDKSNSDDKNEKH
jgi:sec-independent protein translocase protein TatA